MSDRTRWSDERLDDRFDRTDEAIADVRSDIAENRRESREGRDAVLKRLDEQDTMRESARMEARKSNLQLVGVLLGALITTAGGVLIAVLT